MARSLRDLEDAADRAIRNEEEFVRILAEDNGRRLSAVKRASWFHTAVMAEMAATQAEWQHLVDRVMEL